MDFTLWIGPLPVRWLARFEAVTDYGFTDRQVRGPFKAWVHRHTFEPASNGTWVDDRVHMELRAHPLWVWVGLGMAVGLPALFDYRARKTRRLLEGV